MIEAESPPARRKQRKRPDTLRSGAALPEETDVKRRLADARERVSRPRTNHQPSPDRARRRYYRRTETLRRRGRPIDAGRLAHATAALVEALSQNCADTFSLKDQFNPRRARAFGKTRQTPHDFLESGSSLCSQPRRDAGSARIRAAEAPVLANGVETDPAKATRSPPWRLIARHATASNSSISGHVSFWSFSKDDKLSTAITSARVPFEFALVSFVLTLLSVPVGLPC